MNTLITIFIILISGNYAFAQCECALVFQVGSTSKTEAMKEAQADLKEAGWKISSKKSSAVKVDGRIFVAVTGFRGGVDRPGDFRVQVYEYINSPIGARLQPIAHYAGDFNTFEDLNIVLRNVKLRSDSTGLLIDLAIEYGKGSIRVPLASDKDVSLENSQFENFRYYSQG